MKGIQNPILTGFNPDPCIIRVEDDYYIITSTFEWVPGIPVYHSKDLKNWRLLTHILTNIDFRGNPDSCSIWAPAISYNDGQFYVVYTNMTRSQYPFKDGENYLMTATDIMGPWSEPICLSRSSFDPSLFHDDDGRKWFLDVNWDFRIGGRNKSNGIKMQEYCPNQKKLIGPVHWIFKGTKLKKTEAAHIYKYQDYYYLITAEGGTGKNHAVTVARSKSVTGPYEVDPQNPMLTAAYDPSIYLQKAGHASLVSTQNGEWYMAHLCSRPVDGKYSILGRETALQKVYWTEDGWLRLECGGNQPQTLIKAPALPAYPFPIEHDEMEEFNGKKLGKAWYSLRMTQDPSWCSLTQRPGYLRLKGGESIHSHSNQHLIARRQQHFQCEVETKIDFEPMSYLQMAGLVLYYNTAKYTYLYISRDEEKGKVLNIMQSRFGEWELSDFWIPLNEGECKLKAVINHTSVQFYYNQGENWRSIGRSFDIGHLADEGGGFTGNFVGMCAQDLLGIGLPADFDYFYYKGVVN
jgi:xylan 1,4-beta-xylosidase